MRGLAFGLGLGVGLGLGLGLGSGLGLGASNLVRRGGDIVEVVVTEVGA